MLTYIFYLHVSKIVSRRENQATSRTNHDFSFIEIPAGTVALVLHMFNFPGVWSVTSVRCFSYVGKNVLLKGNDYICLVKSCTSVVHGKAKLLIEGMVLMFAR